MLCLNPNQNSETAIGHAEINARQGHLRPEPFMPNHHCKVADFLTQRPIPPFLSSFSPISILLTVPASLGCHNQIKSKSLQPPKKHPKNPALRTALLHQPRPFPSLLPPNNHLPAARTPRPDQRVHRGPVCLVLCGAGVPRVRCIRDAEAGGQALLVHRGNLDASVVSLVS